MSDNVWVATIHDEMQVTTQVTASREDALAWVVSQIPQSDWQAFFDSLAETERAGLTRDKNGMGSQELIEAYAGPDDEGQPDVWGNDLYLVTVEEQTVWTRP